MLKYILQSCAVLFVICMLSGCEKKNTAKDIITPIDTLCERGIKYMDKGSYKRAARNFESICLQHPRHSLVPYAELMEAYAYYKSEQYDRAIAAFRHFIKYYPAHDDVAYAYYMVGLSHICSINDIHRDISALSKAKDSLSELIKLFPETKYAQDSNQKIATIDNYIAAKEMSIGVWYLGVRNAVGALSRFKTVATEYQHTPSYQESIYRMAEAYIVLGLTDEAAKCISELETKTPDSDWARQCAKLISSLR